jgi:drug/metabolite transporter (DMT)-like permease
MNAFLAIIIAAVAFSFYPILNSYALESTSPFLLAMLIQIVTIITAGLFFTNRMKTKENIVQIHKDFFKLPFEIKIIPVLSGVAIYLGGVFFLFSLTLMSKAGASLIMETWPILAIFLAPMLIHKKWAKFRLIDIVLIILSLLGLLMITASEKDIALNAFFSDPFYAFRGSDLGGYFGIITAFLASMCFAWASVLRSYFANILPDSFRIRHFGKTETIREANFTYYLTYLVGLPFSVISFLLMEQAYFFEWQVILPVIFIAISLTITSAFYSYSLLRCENTNINLLWYLSPVLAAIWLTLFGYSQITEMLIAGGFLIIVANVILILTSRDSKIREFPHEP